ncbi:MAG: peroxidase family protein [Ketobacteraceae bacterium]|nr:peroxidase family protein [Ketobacteraceae bacterium]
MSAYMKWWVFGPLIGLLTLANIRCQLFENNLFDTYADGDWPTVECTDADMIYRSADGRCNDLELPAMGMSGMRMGRNIQPDASFMEPEKLLEPNPREISKELLTRTDGIREVPFLNYLAASWIQFMIHDWFEHGLRDHDNQIKVPVDSTDTHNSGDGTMPVGRTPEDTSPHASDYDETYINENTAWWDGSQIYGSDQETQNRLRSFVDGKMIVVNGRLPVDPEKGIVDTGFNRNWWIGLELMHTLFVLEHNKIADMLKSNYPDWTDEQLFQTARLINAAEMAKIHTVDWTPAILKNDILRDAMFTNWRGLLPMNFPRLGNPATDGIIAGPTLLEGVPFSLTEEFTAVYRMHPLLRDELEVRDAGTDQVIGVSALPEHSFAGSTAVADSYGISDLLYSFGRTHPGLLELNNYPDFLMNFPFEEGVPMTDLGAVDIIRDRERGIPRYNEFRRQIGLKPVSDFTDITPDVELAEKMRDLYNDDIEALDVMIGSFAEGYRPPGYGFGETSFQIFIAMASRRLMADRFFTVDYRPEIYTPEGLDWIDDVTFTRVLIRNFPELASQLENVENGFFPWDEENEWFELKVRR